MDLQICMKHDGLLCHPESHTKCAMYHILDKKNLATHKEMQKLFPDFKLRVPTQQEVEYQSTYELTLTTTKDDPYELRTWSKKIADSKIFGVHDMPYCIELTKNGLPHIHALIYSTKKYIDGSKVKKLGYPYRYECKRVIDLSAYNNYIIKEKNNTTIIEYCQRKGIPQFDNAKTPILCEEKTNLSQKT